YCSHRGRFGSRNGRRQSVPGGNHHARGAGCRGARLGRHRDPTWGVAASGGRGWEDAAGADRDRRWRAPLRLPPRHRDNQWTLHVRAARADSRVWVSPAEALSGSGPGNQVIERSVHRTRRKWNKVPRQVMVAIRGRLASTGWVKTSSRAQGPRSWLNNSEEPQLP